MDDDISPADARTLRFLKGLVTALTLTMILGVIAIVALLVMRVNQSGRVTLPESITLPAGETATAFTQGNGWYAVVTGGNEILIFNRATGEITQRIKIEPGN